LPVSGFGRSGSVAPGGTLNYEGKKLAPGMISELNAGDDIQVVNPQGAGADASNFLKMQQRLIGSGQGLSYEATSRDMSETNYSSARQAGIEDDLTFAEEVLLHTWVASPKRWIDPLKEANANRIAMESGQKTFVQIAAENGRDWKGQLDEMAEVQAYAAEKGVQIGGVINETGKEPPNA